MYIILFEGNLGSHVDMQRTTCDLNLQLTKWANYSWMCVHACVLQCSFSLALPLSQDRTPRWPHFPIVDPWAWKKSSVPHRVGLAICFYHRPFMIHGYFLFWSRRTYFDQWSQQIMLCWIIDGSCGPITGNIHNSHFIVFYLFILLTHLCINRINMLQTNSTSWNDIW